MESIDLGPILSRVNDAFTKVDKAAQDVFQKNGFKSSSLYVELSEIGGSLAEISRELTILESVIRIGEQNLTDPNVPSDHLENLKHHLDEAIKKGKRYEKKAEKALAEADKLLAQEKAFVPDKTILDSPEQPQKTVPPEKTKPVRPESFAAPKKIVLPKYTGNIIDGVYKGSIDTRNLPIGYYKSIQEPLLSAVEKGMGRDAVKFADLNESLQLNVQAFAGAKTYNLVGELEVLKSQITDYAEYEAKAKAIVNQYHSWGEAEVNTAQQQASQARQWAIIEDDADLFPLLKYQTIGDACKICKPLDGIVAPVGSPIWVKIYPCNHYNCYCIVTQHLAGQVELTDKKTLAGLVNGSTKFMAPVFQSNPGITKQIYTAKHPYFSSIPKDDKEFAKENFGLPIK